MTELPDTNGGNGSASDKKEDQGAQSLETAAAALASVGATEGEGSSNSESLAAPASGKRDHNGTTPGIMGASAKRGKREWLSFRGARHTRVGEEYQVASLPPMGGISAKPDDTTDDNEKGN
eukprot:CAMPEP_0197279950 /NCGR_PEP_ID=MMETSP1432-20130617/20813_1 /TAXON_ID=44447 /ORGANISM="Pseudo-nitzschia delicatissima, Strain UNC1205" /LENGTH=120 /DNA_ID=CAMNT_0042746557 /DNA_START=13 /DNA_END=375 /DNA_ORIENTATION=+